jgi:histidyl-tRNA synthetase
MAITSSLRAIGVRVDRAFDNRSMKSQMKAADRSGAQFAIIVGSDELEAGSVVVRPLRAERSDDSQSSIARTDLISYMKKALK